jgi:hypothetical protein
MAFQRIIVGFESTIIVNLVNCMAIFSQTHAFESTILFVSLLLTSLIITTFLLTTINIY